MIQVEALSYSYPAREEKALQDVNLEVPEGQFCAVVGANGSGKSTLCYALTGFIPHFYQGMYEGSVRVAGIDVAATPLSELAGDIGLVFQDPFNQISGARFSVREEVAFGLENLGVPREAMEERIAEALRIAGLEGLEERSPYALSGGQQQRLALASVLVMRPKVLVLDEPTSQLDPVGTREAFSALDRLVRERSMTVVITEHKLEWLAQYADRVVALSQGKVVADGPPRAVLGAEGLPEHGVGQTCYTLAAREARRRGLAEAKGPLPVTIEQAVEFFA